MQQADHLRLRGLRPLAQGSYRSVYQHPHAEHLLVKVLRPRKHPPRLHWHKPWRHFMAYRTLSRELRQYKVLDKRGLGDLPFLQKFHGAVETDLGWGIAVQKITDRDGGLAPTLTRVVKERGLSDDLRRKLHALREQIVDHGIVFMDVSGNNIVLAGGFPDERLVVIDGLGNRLLIPLNAMSATINRRNTLRYFERAIRQLEEFDRQRSAGAPASPAGR